MNLLAEDEPDVPPLEVPPKIGRERRGRRACSEPAMMPMPSSITDQRPIFPVPNMNSVGLL